MIPSIPNTSDMLPPADELRRQLADARQAVAVLDGLLKLRERVVRRRGRPVATATRPDEPAERAVACAS